MVFSELFQFAITSKFYEYLKLAVSVNRFSHTFGKVNWIISHEKLKVIKLF
jgi:hypothetical protein